jgi:calcineurin-like phosphoesterase
MVGPTESVIGDDSDAVIKRFLTQIPSRLSVGKGEVSFDAILVEVDEKTGKAIDIRRIQKLVD